MSRPARISRMARQPMLVIGAAIVLFLVLVALFGPGMVKGDPYAMEFADRLKPPGGEHLLGTDDFGRDMLARIVHGAPLTLRIGTITVLIALLVGGIPGLLAGYFGRSLDLVVMGMVDLMLAFPFLMLALAIVAILGPGLTNTMLAVGLATAPVFTRLVRAMTLEVRENLYVEGAVATGASAWRVLLRHVGPNILAPLIVLIALQFPAALLSTAALGFVGLGAQPPQPEWGAMLAAGKDYMRRAPWMVNAPGFAIMFTVLGFNLFGNALRDLMDPSRR